MPGLALLAIGALLVSSSPFMSVGIVGTVGMFDPLPRAHIVASRRSLAAGD
jgi:hypothetical protein